MQLALQQLFGRQLGHILRHLDARLVELQQLYLLVATFGAKQQSEGLFLAWLHLVGFEPTQIQLHLAFVLRLEFTKFQVDGYQAV